MLDLTGSMEGKVVDLHEEEAAGSMEGNVVCLVCSSSCSCSCLGDANSESDDQSMGPSRDHESGIGSRQCNGKQAKMMVVAEGDQRVPYQCEPLSAVLTMQVVPPARRLPACASCPNCNTRWQQQQQRQRWQQQQLKSTELNVGC